MKAIVRTPLHQVRAKEESEQAKDAQLQELGFSLAQEIIKSAQKDAMINALGQELTLIKIELAQLKGVISQ